MKRFISMMLAISMILGILPVGEMVAFAGDDKATIDKIIVNKTYESIEDYGNFFITLTGDNLDKAEVKIMEFGGELQDPEKSGSSGRYVAQYNYPASDVGQRLFIDGKTYTLGEEDMPRITGRDGATTKIIKSGENVTLTGENIYNLFENKDTNGNDIEEIKGYFSQSGSKSYIKDNELVDEDGNPIESGEENVKINKNVGTVTGNHSLIFEKETEDNDIPIEIEHTYKSIIIVRGDLIVEGEISIFPSQGPTETWVTITADKIESDVSVFLMPKGKNYKFTKENMANNDSVSHVQEDGKEKIKFKVPKALKNGQHEIVLTNKVDPTKDIDEQISGEKLIGNNINAVGKYEEDDEKIVDFKTLDFNIVDGSSGVDLNKITPNYSSIKGVPAKIEGRNIIKISPNLYEKGDDEGLDEDSIDITNNKKMILKFEGGEYNGDKIKSIKRTITVQIGTNAIFTGHDITGNVYDYLDIIVPENDDLDKPVKDVIVFITNDIVFENGEEETITEGDTIENGFTYKPIDYEPEIKEIIPNTIPVDSSGKVTDDFIISITGENFLKYGYIDDKTLKTKSPKITVDKQGTSFEWFDNDNIKMYDQTGKPLNETEGEQFANIIKIKINKDSQIPKSIIDSTQKLKLQNPLAVESEGDMGSSAFGEITFVEVDPDDTPIVKDVNPSTITTEGADGIVIIGTNFREDVSIILDGERIDGFDRNGVGTELIFDAPPKPEDIYQIIVQNGNGGATTFDKFEYVETRTSPKFNDFSPKEGTRDTLVTIKGENFLTTDPLVKNISSSGIFRLIGTRVKLGGVDVNEYNEDADGQIVLKEFKSNKKILTIEDEAIKPSSYVDDVVLVNDKGGSPNDEYFKIYKNFRTDKIILTDGRKDYEIYAKSGKIYTDYNNNEIEVDLSIDGVLKIKDAIEKEGEIEDLVLKIKTPYSIGNKIIRYKQIEEDGETKYIRDELGAYVKDIKAIGTEEEYIKIEDIDDIETKRDDLEIEGGITGNNVKVLNNENPSNSELTFIVPEKMKEGYYDVSIVNPDTKTDSKVGENGFYYYLQPQRPITITKIYPNKGSTEGDYYINIEGTNFRDNGDGDKPRVIIGGERVEAKNIEVSTNGENLRVRVPKYPGDLNSETDTGRRTVPVVVVNPDGASDNVEEGFTYIVPKSNPEIKKLVLDKGSASGGQIINIIGTDFRFYEPYVDINGNNKWDDKGEADTDGDGLITAKDPAESYDDLNGDSTWTDITDVDMEDLINNNKIQDNNILPTIYIGNKEAEIVSFREGQIDIKVPQGQEASVDVYVVNNDYGTSNKVKYTYETSSPSINSIIPNVGRKQGNEKIEILGGEFHNSKIKYIKKTEDNKIEDDIKSMPLIRFGDLNDKNMSNRDIDLGQQYSGQIIGGRSEVKVGDLTIEYLYKKDSTELTFILNKGGEEKEVSYDSYDSDKIYFPMNLLDSRFNEYVEISLEQTSGVDNSRRLRVERGFSPDAKLLNSGQISLRTPSYYTVGKTKITIINPDGGTDDGDFEYKNPDSSPTITNILRDTQEGKIEDVEEGTRKIVRVNVSGGNTIDIIGTDFRKPVSIKIGDIPEITTGIEYDPSNEAISQKMTFEMPAVDEKYVNEIHRVVIENEDGGTAGSDSANPPIYIQFIKSETPGLEIIDVDPKAGPTKGGTEITITGKDFRKSMEGFEGEELKVYFGKGSDQIMVSDILSVSIDKIILKTPPHSPGTVSIKVENPDGSISEKDDAYTYVSNPKITSILDENGSKKQTLFIDGGEELSVKGTDFIEGARVIFNPVLKKASENPDVNGESIFIEDKGKVIEYILESGTEGIDVEFVDSENIKVVTPPGQLNSGGVIVINPDDAATSKYDIKYTIEDIDHPQDVRASLINDEYIRINWETVTDKATEEDGKTVQYEVYAISGNSRELIGSTGSTGFVFRDIEPNTTYKFLVRAVGKYGSSKPIDESMSNEVRTGSESGSKDDDGELGEKTTVNKSGDTANIVIGEDAFSKGNEYVIDLTRGTLAGSDKVVMSMSARIVVNGSSRKVKIIGKDYGLTFSPNVFENATMITNEGNVNAGVKFEVLPTNTNLELAQNNGDIILSSKYFLRGRTYVASNSNEIENLNGKMNFILDYDSNMATTRRIKTIKLVKYDAYDRRFKNIVGSSEYGTYSGDINELGTYTITGSRR